MFKKRKPGFPAYTRILLVGMSVVERVERIGAVLPGSAASSATWNGTVHVELDAATAWSVAVWRALCWYGGVSLAVGAVVLMALEIRALWRAKQRDSLRPNTNETRTAPADRRTLQKQQLADGRKQE